MVSSQQTGKRKQQIKSAHVFTFEKDTQTRKTALIVFFLIEWLLCRETGPENDGFWDHCKNKVKNKSY